MNTAEHHYLLIPPTGLMEVFHAEEAFDAHQVLTIRHAKGAFINLGFTIDDGPEARAQWFSDSTEPLNPRAREAFAYLTGVQMIFSGPVIFSGIHPDRVAEVVTRLSRRE